MFLQSVTRIYVFFIFLYLYFYPRDSRESVRSAILMETVKQLPRSSGCTSDMPAHRGGAVLFPTLGRVEMACRFPEGLIFGRLPYGQFFSFYPCCHCAVTGGRHS